jgi:hypothetical protein
MKNSISFCFLTLRANRLNDMKKLVTAHYVVWQELEVDAVDDATALEQAIEAWRASEGEWTEPRSVWEDSPGVEPDFEVHDAEEPSEKE